MNTKNIYGFNVLINDDAICRAGFEKENSIVTCIVSSLRRESDESEELNITVGGLNSETNQAVNWLESSLHDGDKITIEVISGEFDPPNTVRDPKPKKDIIAQKMERYHQLKEELKDYL